MCTMYHIIILLIITVYRRKNFRGDFISRLSLASKIKSLNYKCNEKLKWCRTDMCWLDPGHTMIVMAVNHNNRGHDSKHMRSHYHLTVCYCSNVSMCLG